MIFHNYTGKDLVVCPEGSVLTGDTMYPEGTVSYTHDSTRCKESGFLLEQIHRTRIFGLPEPRPGHTYIVPAEVALLVIDRGDLCFPANDVLAEPDGTPVGTSYFLTTNKEKPATIPVKFTYIRG